MEMEDIKNRRLNWVTTPFRNKQGNFQRNWSINKVAEYTLEKKPTNCPF